MRNWQAGLAALSLVGVVQGCATLGQDFSGQRWTEIRLGKTTESDLLQIFGTPFAKTLRMTPALDSTVYSWAYIRAGLKSASGRELKVEIVNGTVNAYLFRSALGEDQTDFDTGLRETLHPMSSRIEDARKVLGPPHGEIRLPSNLLDDEYRLLPEVIPPDNASTAIVYNYFVIASQHNLIHGRLKLLVLFANRESVITAIRVFDGRFR